MELDRHRLEAQRQRRVVADAVGEAVLAHVAGRVFRRAERLERIVIKLVDGRAGQAEKERVRQRQAHPRAEVALLRAVCFVHQDDDVRAFVQHVIDVAKAEDRRDGDFPRVLLEKSFDVFFCRKRREVRDVRRLERRRDLRLEVEAVVDDDDGPRDTVSCIWWSCSS